MIRSYRQGMATAGVNIKNLFGGMILTLLISVFVMTLSCLLGYVVAKVSLKLKHKSMITVLVSLIFIGGYYMEGKKNIYNA